MDSSVGIRRSSRIKRPTVAFTAPVAKRVKTKPVTTTTLGSTVYNTTNDTPATRSGNVASSVASGTEAIPSRPSDQPSTNSKSSTPAGTSEAPSSNSLTGTLLGMSKGPPGNDSANSRYGNHKPSAHGSPPAWSDVRPPSNSLLIIASFVGKPLICSRTVSHFARRWNTTAHTRARFTTMTAFATASYLITRLQITNIWTRKSLLLKRKS